MTLLIERERETESEKYIHYILSKVCIYRIKTGYIVWHHESFQASTEVLGSYPLRKMTDYCTHTVLVGKYV